MGCVLGCFLLCAPNTMASLEITDSIFNKLYEKYIRKIKNGFSLDTIYFSDSDISKDLKNLVSKKLVIELNKLEIKKYSFWTGYAIDFVSIQLAYFIFSKLINTDYQFSMKDTEMNICNYEIPFDFIDEQIDEFKRSFFLQSRRNNETKNHKNRKVFLKIFEFYI